MFIHYWKYSMLPAIRKRLRVICVLLSVVLIILIGVTLMRERIDNLPVLEEVSRDYELANSTQTITMLPTSPLATSSTLTWKVPGNHVTDWTKPDALSWEPGFCKEFIGDTFDKTTSVCGLSSETIVCQGTKHNKNIGTCSLSNVAISPAKLYDAMGDRKVLKSESSWLVPNVVNYSKLDSCPSSNFHQLETYMESPDPFRAFVKMTALQVPKGECTVWVEGTTFFYMGMANHIYFKFLGWYNLHRSLLAHRDLKNFTIVRIPEDKNKFLFPEYERMLFPEVVTLQDFTQNIVCFNRIVLVPWAYAATPFRCKMDGSFLKQKCSQCNGKGLETDLQSFRRRVISACSLQDRQPFDNHHQKSVVVIQRKQYFRRLGDVAHKFQRVWKNSDELVARLKQGFPDVIINGIYGEDLEICQQVSIVHNADILIAMHGAGLVHLWWLQDNSVSIELVPASQRGNGAFITLATLLGKAHHQFTHVTERGSIVNVDIDKLIKEVQSILDL